ncbi:hypothetical protein [Sphingomonas oryzagri]|uniref:MFS transporter n=1 Tax=Sphingomonas oryzagri TaxID=3042314 RepID=A0ABT6N5T3_9SPHN|nr:hypothetical protein [Sphingomonas oryzagri]MDH7640456.1 hypothetical protein [Sphingomonas oryzagri]
MTDSPTPIAPIEKAETVNVTPPLDAGETHPLLVAIIAGFSLAVLTAFAIVTFFVLNHDVNVSPETRGSIIQTWNNLAVGVGTVWLSSKIIDLVARRRVP